MEQERCKRRKLGRRLGTSSECPVIGDLTLLDLTGPDGLILGCVLCLKVAGSWPLGFAASVRLWLGLRELWSTGLWSQRCSWWLWRVVCQLCVCVSPQAGHNFHNADMSYVKKLCGTFLGGPKLPER